MSELTKSKNNESNDSVMAEQQQWSKENEQYRIIHNNIKTSASMTSLKVFETVKLKRHSEENIKNEQ